MNLVPFFSTFVIITLAELGDKTQLTAITLSTKHNPKIVFLSSMLAFTMIGGISIIIGSALSSFLPMFWIKIGSGVVFVFSGIYTFFSEEETESTPKQVSFVTSFSLVALMELGDKTQLATIALSARYVSPVLVFLGMFLAFSLITGIGVVLGTKIKEFLSTRYIKIGASLVFVLFGIIFLIGAATGITFF